MGATKKMCPFFLMTHLIWKIYNTLYLTLLIVDENLFLAFGAFLQAVDVDWLEDLYNSTLKDRLFRFWLIKCRIIYTVKTEDLNSKLDIFWW